MYVVIVNNVKMYFKIKTYRINRQTKKPVAVLLLLPNLQLLFPQNCYIMHYGKRPNNLAKVQEPANCKQL